MTKKIILTLLPLTLLATPNAPSTLHLTPTKTTVLVSWRDKSENETGFKIFRDDKLIHITKQNEQSYLDKGLKAETTYHYEVKATDDEQIEYISIPKKIYKNQPITAYLSNLSQSDKDWVGIFYDQRTAKYKGIDRKHLLAWNYKNKGTDRGEILVDKLMAEPLKAGDYEARLFFDDSYDTVAKVYFTIVDENPPLQVTVDENIKISYQNTAGNEKDWISIYKIGDNNEWDNVLRWDYTKGKIDGESSFPLLDNGEYEARLFYNNSYVPESVVKFTIGDKIVGTNLIETYGAVCDGDTNDTQAIQNALDDYKNWENRTLIFPKDRVCRANGLELQSIQGTSDKHYTLIGNNSTIKALDGTYVERDMKRKSWILWIKNGSYIDIKKLNFDGNKEKRYIYNSRNNSTEPMKNLQVSYIEKDADRYQNHFNSNLVVSYSSYINIDNIYSKNAVSDNIYIGSPFGNGKNTNIKLINCHLLDAFRNNLTLSRCNYCEINGGEYNGALGVSPEAGIDLEADLADNENYIGTPLSNITIKNADISNNYGPGISSSQIGNPQNIYIINNTINSNRKSIRYCRDTANNNDFKNVKAMAINIGFKDSNISGNIFATYTVDKTDQEECKALLDFYSTGKTDGNVTVSKNTFKDLHSFKENNKPYIYIHGDNGGRHTIVNNNFETLAWYTVAIYDSHKNDNNSSTIQNNIFKNE